MIKLPKKFVFIKKIIQGFTLVEILVVLSIIAGVGIFSFVGIPTQIQRVRDAVRKYHLDSMKKAVEEYYQDSGCYPQTIPTCSNPLKLGSLIIDDSLSCDPKTNLSYTYVPEISDCPKWFQIYANLEYVQDKVIDKIGCRSGCGPDCQFNYGVASPNQNLNPFCQPEENAKNTPIEEQGEQIQYVCAPGGSCEIYVNPEISGCPDVYLDDPTCQNACETKDNRCHDSKGKIN